MTRLSRKTIAGLLAVSAVVIMAGTLWALRPMEKKPSPDELYSTEHRAVAEGVTRLPRDYSSVASAAGAPKLGPPLPGDLGLPIVAAQAGGRMAAGATPAMGPTVPGASAVADQARDQRLKAAQDAVGSPLFSVSDRGRAAPATGEVAADGGSSLIVPTAAETPGPSGSTPSRHEAFANTVGDQQSVSAHRLEAPASPYSVLAGTVISAALVTGLNSHLPGQVIATVTAPVYDTVSGRILLIPQGARLLGTYDSQTAFGDSRALVVWTRLILPNGRSVILDRLSGVDAQGFAGVADSVDHHWRRLIGGAAVSSLLGVGAELATPQTSGGDGQIVIATRNGVQDTVNQVGQELTRRNLDIKPTIKVRPGFPLRVLVSRDLVLEPYSSPRD
ncbi:conjugal transfer protein TraI [Phenylobacterium sp. LjRoot225]|uniref:TrbI/VirB10 family protein n=1 Tax=Phenylobacterium sp. LjRoot225 TaxID=3342285 RepID=UPI003ECF8F5D